MEFSTVASIIAGDGSMKLGDPMVVQRVVNASTSINTSHYDGPGGIDAKTEEQDEMSKKSHGKGNFEDGSAIQQSTVSTKKLLKYSVDLTGQFYSFFP